MIWIQSISQLKVRQVFYPTSQAAWEGINEIFIKGDPILFTKGEGGRISSSAIYAYNVVVNIRKAWMDPEFVLVSFSIIRKPNGIFF